jgi:hypothetical protein
MFRYEHRSLPLLGFGAFLRRVALHGGVAIAIVALSLGGGVLGYRYTEGMNWLDALLNASMILTGMGPATEMTTAAGKLFASCYALYSGIVFLVVMSLLLAPFVHRLLHRLHAESRSER